MKSKFNNLTNDELLVENGGGVLMGAASAVLGTLSASVAIVSAISVPVTGWAGVGVASGGALMAKECYEEAFKEFAEGTLW
ncbi:MAG: hypothetical protein Q4A29_03080 [Eubacteriales bacterium]|nr:hypothetical protein [Eubacteriales bacterium]